MNYYHIDNPDSYHECYKAEIEHYAELMSTLDRAIIHSNLPPVGKTKDLFDMVDALLYIVEKRYKKEHNIEEEDRGLFFSDVTEDKLIDRMRTMLKEEIVSYFSQVSGSHE
jgi:hypothetical protein